MRHTISMLRTILVAALLSVSVLAQAPTSRQFLIRLEPVRKDFTLMNMTDDERAIIKEHGKYLHSLFAQGTLTFGGQVLDPKGLWGILIVNAPDIQAATDILNGDPTIKNKMFRGEAIPFNTGFERGASPPENK